MSTTIYEMDLANIFAGDPDPKNSLHNTLKSFKLPALKQKMKDHSATGAAMDVRWGMNKIDALEFTFKAAGFDMNLMARFGIGTNLAQPFTVLGNIRDLQTGREMSGRAVVRGKIVELDASEHSGEGIEHDYKIDEVTHYELFIDDKEVYYFDFWEGPAGVRVNGVVIFQNAARNLGLL